MNIDSAIGVKDKLNEVISWKVKFLAKRHARSTHYKVLEYAENLLDEEIVGFNLRYPIIHAYRNGIELDT